MLRRVFPDHLITCAWPVSSFFIPNLRTCDCADWHGAGGGAERRRRPHEEAPSFWGWHFSACPCAAYSCWRFGSAASRRPASQTVIMWTTTSGQSAYSTLQRAMDQPVAATAKRTASEECVSAARHTPSARTAMTARQATIPKRASAYPVTIVSGTGRRWIVKGTTQFSGGPNCNVIQQTAPATANSVGVARDVSIRIHRPPRLFLLRPHPCLRLRRTWGRRWRAARGRPSL